MKSDAQLKKDVEAELEWDPSINATQVGVAVKDGVVTLSGHLDTFVEKYEVEKVVQRVAGVRAVDPTALDRLGGESTGLEEPRGPQPLVEPYFPLTGSHGGIVPSRHGGPEP